MEKVSKILVKYEIWIPILLGLFFVLITIPGISWGTPEIWHPDELVLRVIRALDGEWQFDQTNFDYPSLPKYVMYGVGKLVYGLGYSVESFIIAARFVSVLLGALVVALTYYITRLVDGNIAAAVFAALLLISNSEFALNARWAHNDLYVTFFVSLALLAVIKFSCSSTNRLWLYLSFFAAGMAASSKYNGGSIVLTPAIMYLFLERKDLRKKVFRIVETLFIGLVLSVFGYGIGTPTALLWLAFYIKRLTPALTRHSLYGQGPESVIGAISQWGTLSSFWGMLVFVLILVALGYTFSRLIQHYLRYRDFESQDIGKLAILISVMALEIPILFSYNVQQRFFLPMAPMLAVLAALFLQDLVAYARKRQKRMIEYSAIGIATILVAYSFLRVISVFLLLTNDSRIEVSEYLKTLQPDTRVEYTLYPPTFPEDHFSSVKTYPLVFLKYLGQATPESRHYELNVGETGVENRQPDYLVVDSFTIDRFDDEYICSLHLADCAFFERLRDGDTNYQLIASFEYTLPVFLPKPHVAFVNPNLYLYQRVSASE